ncbi:hypothetical protein F5Y06DRAFT_174524 [Hypoxylon sp. FL0890]|nr:hypothetical protein F5Y06DRAFT_174524 [Hypoxylon sp. FL0890]
MGIVWIALLGFLSLCYYLQGWLVVEGFSLTPPDYISDFCFGAGLGRETQMEDILYIWRTSSSSNLSTYVRVCHRLSPQITASSRTCYSPPVASRP